MLIKKNTTYAYVIQHLKNLSFECVRNEAARFRNGLSFWFDASSRIKRGLAKLRITKDELVSEKLNLKNEITELYLEHNFL